MPAILYSPIIHFRKDQNSLTPGFYKARTFCLLFLLLSVQSAFTQSLLPHYPDSLFSSYYHQRVSQFELTPNTPEDIIFLGNSITDGGEWNELFQDKHIKNRGISGDVTIGVINRIGNVVSGNPGKVFLLIGVNDLARGISPDSIFQNIRRIVSLIHIHSPATEVYVQSIFPVNRKPGKFPSHVNKKEQIKYINARIRNIAGKDNFTYVNVYDGLKDKDDALDLKYTNDGLHLMGSGYMKWKHIVYPYIYGLQPQPSLIPKPRSLKWSNAEFPLYECRSIVAGHDSLKPLARVMEKILKSKGIKTDIGGNSAGQEPFIELRVGNMPSRSLMQEAYTLTVTDKKVTITGNTLHGVFNGIQTFRQLVRDGAFVNGCEITDWPAFSWRGYMVDVGRNYQSLKQLKEQIDVMSHYKLNVLHFHLTENVAWRLQIKRYPQLTEAKYMTRNQGEYYTVEAMKELIRYCQERYITLVPEIDMPGHSDAFKRAMGVDMQSDSGLMIMKNILREVDSTYDLPYFHIGADEVIITNNQFIPEVTEVIRKSGKKVLGWKPGGNYDDKAIRQLWNWQSPKPDRQGIYYVDSRDLYLDGMDPLAGVVQIFNKRICDADAGNDYLLGGEICAWNDIRIKEEKDFLTTNPIYPSMVTFGERSWRGNGYNIKLDAFETDTSRRFKDFVEFENRILDTKKEFFKNKPFPYVRQTNIQWKLFGPFDNKGNTQTAFWPEKEMTGTEPGLPVNGGTISLDAFLKVVAKDSTEYPQPNTTWYAFRNIYSPVDTVGYFWISFYNVGRSQHVATPQSGDWDRKGGKVWINGIPVSPPQWTYPGRRGEQETPLANEGYEYRPPTKVHLKKGVNSILVKTPIAKTYRLDWLDPVRWMFTVVRVGENESCE